MRFFFVALCIHFIQAQTTNTAELLTSSTNSTSTYIFSTTTKSSISASTSSASTYIFSTTTKSSISASVFVYGDQFYKVSTFTGDSAAINDGGNWTVLNTSNLPSTRCINIALRFAINFYGNTVSKVTLCLHGFLIMDNLPSGVFSNSTMYVAPLMGDVSATQLDQILSYRDNGNALFVSWDGVSFSAFDSDLFSFRCTLFQNGTLVFNYIGLPDKFTQGQPPSAYEALRAGISDGYYRNTSDQTHPIPYTSIPLNLSTIRNGSGVIFTPLPTCSQQKSCSGCLTMPANLKCQWCGLAKLCSGGTDRNYFFWTAYQCNYNMISRVSDCNVYPTPAVAIFLLIFLVLVCLAVLAGIVCWCHYAYKHPNSHSGQWMIEHRPRVLWNKYFRKKNQESQEAYSFGFAASSVA